jgi:hypothetical protein
LVAAAEAVAAGVALLAALSVLLFVDPHAASTSMEPRTPRRANLGPIDVDMSLLTGMVMGW